jgi:hypothetical protein
MLFTNKLSALAVEGLIRLKDVHVIDSWFSRRGMTAKLVANTILHIDENWVTVNIRITVVFGPFYLKNLTIQMIQRCVNKAVIA